MSTCLVFKAEKSPVDSGFCYKARLGGYIFEIYQKVNRSTEDTACFAMFGRTRVFKNLDSGLMDSKQLPTLQEAIDFLHQKATDIDFAECYD